jgi:ADP-ribosylglycohydrolase
LRGSLLGLLAGDALAAPTHWYYGGQPQVVSSYGGAITTYTTPTIHLSGSIMAKSNVNGGGRGSYAKDAATGKSIIGDVINHGKYEHWDPKQSHHYHATLSAGEETLEGSLVRLLLRTITADGGKVSAASFRDAYVRFMTTPGSHNDAYASTCHRMFFANHVFRGLHPKDCPDNDGHNVDSVDGLVLPAVAAMAASASGLDEAAVRKTAADIAAVTRNSAVLSRWSSAWAVLARSAIHSDKDEDVIAKLGTFAAEVGIRRPDGRRGEDIAACYLEGNIPGALDAVARWVPRHDMWGGLLANANAGGENVHRGALIGSVLGARDPDGARGELVDGLHNAKEIEAEVDAFVLAVLALKRKQRSDL